MKPNDFELLFVTEGESANPAAEIQFGGQRLCIVRPSPEHPGQFDVEFLTDLYVLPQSVKMVFPAEAFINVLQQARSDLQAWLSNLARAGTQA